MQILAETLRFGASAAGWSPGSDDGRPHNERMVDYMTIYKTTDYFNITKEEASKICNGYDTREEAKFNKQVFE